MQIENHAEKHERQKNRQNFLFGSSKILIIVRCISSNAITETVAIE